MNTPLVPFSQERELPQDQYTPGTSEVAKGIGKVISAVDDKVKEYTGLPFVGDIGPENAKTKSPMVIDNYIHQFGTMSQYATSVVDAAMKKLGMVEDKSPALKITDIWFVKSFLARNPTQSAAPIALFGEKFKEIEQSVASFKAAKQEYNPQRAKEIAMDHQLDLAKQQFAAKEHAEISRLGKLIRNISNFPLSAMNKDDKSMSIDKLTYTMITRAEQAVKGLHQMDEDYRQKQKQRARP